MEKEAKAEKVQPVAKAKVKDLLVQPDLHSENLLMLNLLVESLLDAVTIDLKVAAKIAQKVQDLLEANLLLARDLNGEQAVAKEKRKATPRIPILDLITCN